MSTVQALQHLDSTLQSLREGIAFSLFGVVLALVFVGFMSARR